jgi:hypothetical protein
MKISCDTDTIVSNIKRHENRVKEKRELEALEKLLACHRAGKIVMFGSLLNLRELEETKVFTQRDKLRADFAALPPLPKDESVHGSERLITDPHGGFICNPIVSDVQDEGLCAELKKRGLTRRDADHITQAVCNHCDIFITRDERTIINPHGARIEAQFPSLQVCLPSEALLEVRAFCP